MAIDEQWIKTPKPQVDVEPPRDIADRSDLIGRTIVYLGSNLGDASSHSNKNLPILVAGGGFQHGRHLAFDPLNSPPLCNLYISMLQRLGIEVDQFNTGRGRLTGLEFQPS